MWMIWKWYGKMVVLGENIIFKMFVIFKFLNLLLEVKSVIVFFIKFDK